MKIESIPLQKMISTLVPTPHPPPLQKKKKIESRLSVEKQQANQPTTLDYSNEKNIRLKLFVYTL